MGQVRGHFRKGRWVSGHERRAHGGAAQPADSSQVAKALLMAFGFLCFITFGGCGACLALSPRVSKPTAPSPPPAEAQRPPAQPTTEQKPEKAFDAPKAKSSANVLGVE